LPAVSWLPAVDKVRLVGKTPVVGEALETRKVPVRDVTPGKGKGTVMGPLNLRAEDKMRVVSGPASVTGKVVTEGALGIVGM
jgi:hypothetical protein